MDSPTPPHFSPSQGSSLVGVCWIYGSVVCLPTRHAGCRHVTAPVSCLGISHLQGGGYIRCTPIRRFGHVCCLRTSCSGFTCLLKGFRNKSPVEDFRCLIRFCKVTHWQLPIPSRESYSSTNSHVKKLSGGSHPHPPGARNSASALTGHRRLNGTSLVVMFVHRSSAPTLTVLVVTFASYWP